MEVRLDLSSLYLFLSLSHLPVLSLADFGVRKAAHPQCSLRKEFTHWRFIPYVLYHSFVSKYDMQTKFKSVSVERRNEVARDVGAVIQQDDGVVPLSQ